VSKQVTDMPVLGPDWVTMLKVIPGTMAANSGGRYRPPKKGTTGLVDFNVNGKTGSTARRT